jgi:Rab GDP dissociation inhibitor
VGSELETGDAVKELTPALKLLGPILEQFVIVTDSFEPIDDGKASGCFITKVFFEETGFVVVLKCSFSDL